MFDLVIHSPFPSESFVERGRTPYSFHVFSQAQIASFDICTIIVRYTNRIVIMCFHVVRSFSLNLFDTIAPRPSFVALYLYSIVFSLSDPECIYPLISSQFNMNRKIFTKIRTQVRQDVVRRCLESVRIARS